MQEFASEPHSADYLAWRGLKEIDYSIDQVRFNVRNRIWLAQPGNTLAMLKIKLEEEGRCPPLDDDGNEIEERKENEIDEERVPRKKPHKLKKLAANVSNWRHPRQHTDAYPDVKANIIPYFSYR